MEHGCRHAPAQTPPYHVCWPPPSPNLTTVSSLYGWAMVMARTAPAQTLRAFVRPWAMPAAVAWDGRDEPPFLIGGKRGCIGVDGANAPRQKWSTGAFVLISRWRFSRTWSGRHRSCLICTSICRLLFSSHLWFLLYLQLARSCAFGFGGILKGQGILKERHGKSLALSISSCTRGLAQLWLFC